MNMCYSAHATESPEMPAAGRPIAHRYFAALSGGCVFQLNLSVGKL